MCGSNVCQRGLSWQQRSGLRDICDNARAHGTDKHNHWRHGLPRLPAYTRDELLNLRYTNQIPPNLLFSSPEFIHLDRRKKKKKRGARGRIWNRLKQRGCRFPLPTMTIQCSITWSIWPGYYTDSKKHRGWIVPVCQLQLCSTHYEILAVSFRPHYLPRKFGQITLMLVNIPGPDFTLAAERIAVSYNIALHHSADDPVFLLWNFNKCDVSELLPNLEQYVTCTTRMNKTLDQWSRPPLGHSDHNVIHLLPKYRQLLKRTKPTVELCQVWTEDAVEKLKGCFEATKWDLFLNDQNCQNNSELLNDTVTSYINFCVDSAIKTKEVTISPNNKQWVNKELKYHLILKKKAFLQNNTQKVKELNNEIINNRIIKKAQID